MQFFCIKMNTDYNELMPIAIPGLKKTLSIVLALALLCVCIPAGAGPIVAPGSELFVIKTGHFDIIFPERSRPSALYLSAIADSVYDEIAAKLETRVSARIPVVISPDIGSFGGYTNSAPYMHIVLVDTSLDIGWTAFRDNLRSLFLHELTHVVSLQIKAPWADFFSGIFGSWVLPGVLNTPKFMLEGVTVSFESADGVNGRANDPLVKARVRQDILENRFKSPIEASGLYDEYPGGTIYYEYGGLFSAYVQKTYGMEKYAELWKGMGTLVFSLSLDPYEIGFYSVFRKTYGLPFVKAWADFRNSLALSGHAEVPEALWPAGRAWMTDGLAGNGSSLFWVDARSYRAYKMDAASQVSSILFDADPSWAISDASAAGDRLLISRALYTSDGRTRAESAIYDLESRRFVPESGVADMREARFFRDGRIGIVSKLHNTSLVFASKAGTEVLLSGSEELMYSSPAVLDASRIALIVAIGGRRNLGIFDVDEKRLSLVKPTGADAGLFAYLRQLSASEGRLYFNYDSDDRLYKLGVLDGDELRVETTDYSGGVLWPEEAGGRVYYVGRFSEGDKICRYPGDAASLGKRPLAFTLEDFDTSPELAKSAETIRAGGEEHAIEPYRPLDYANPFNNWYLYPDLSAYDRSFRPFACFLFQDPIDTNTVSLYAGYDSAYPFADSTLTWTTTALPVAFTTTLGDRLVYGASGPPERQSIGRIFADLSVPASPYPREAVLGIEGSYILRGEGESGSPYSWGYSGWNATASASLGWRGFLPGVAKNSARGLGFMSYHDFDMATLNYKTEAQLVAAIDSPSARLELWGAWATSPIMRLDSTSSVFSSDRRPAYVEYGALREGRESLVAEGAITYRLADQAIHANVLGLYFNRMLVDAGFRGAYFGDLLLSSAFARISFDLGAAAGLAAASIRVFGEGFARLSETDPDLLFGWRLGIRLGASAIGE
jgi:hypothetical protein